MLAVYLRGDGVVDIYGDRERLSTLVHEIQNMLDPGPAHMTSNVFGKSKFPAVIVPP